MLEAEGNMRLTHLVAGLLEEHEERFPQWPNGSAAASGRRVSMAPAGSNPALSAARAVRVADPGGAYRHRRPHIRTAQSLEWVP
jgi:hypothetical protein